MFGFSCCTAGLWFSSSALTCCLVALRGGREAEGGLTEPLHFSCAFLTGDVSAF